MQTINRRPDHLRCRRAARTLAALSVLGSLAGLEVSIREHFAGFRSHSSVLAGAVAVAGGAVLWFVVGLFVGWIYFYPPILFLSGLIAFLIEISIRLNAPLRLLTSGGRRSHARAVIANCADSRSNAGL